MNKQTLLINTALALFYKKGIHAVGINEVLAQSGVAKKTLYHYFDSKNALILACVIERDARFMAWLTKRCADKASMTEFIEDLFSALDDWINNKALSLGDFNGCFFVNAAAEYSDENNQIHQQCLLHKSHVRDFIDQQLKLFKVAAKSNTNAVDNSHTKQLNRCNQSNQMTELLMLLKEGCINCAFVFGDKQAAQRAKLLALQFVSGY